MTEYRAVLRRPDFRKLYAAGVTSASGGAVTGVCILWVVFTTTGSSVDVGFVGTAELLAGVVFSLIGGGLVDRYDRRNLMVAADLVRAADVGVLALSLAFLGFRLPIVLVAAFVVGAFTTIFNPAAQTVIPAVVGTEEVADANGLIQATQSMANLAGASLGGLLILAAGPVYGLGYNVGTFLVSALLIASLSLSADARRPNASGPTRPFVEEVAEGFRWLRRETGLLQLTVSAGFFNFFSTIVVTFLVVYAVVALHGSAAVFGVLLATLVGAQGLGSLAVGHVGSVRWAGRAWVLFYGIAAPLGAVGLGLLPSFPLAIALLAFMGFCNGLAGTTWLSAAQLTVPSEMQGRYFGVDGLGSWAILPAAQIGGGFLIAAIGVERSYLAAGVLWAGFGIAFLFARPLARWGYRPPAGGPGIVPTASPPPG